MAPLLIITVQMPPKTAPKTTNMTLGAMSPLAYRRSIALVA
jgi:hypothetical protein